MKVGKLSLLVLLLVILACGGGGGGSTGNGTPIPDSQREAAIKSVNTKFKQLLIAGGSPATQNAQLATFMAAMPEFEAAGANSDDGCSWGRFTDGRLLVVGNNRFPDRSPGQPFAWTRRALKTYVSKSQQARLMHAFGANFSQLQLPITDMSNYLKTDAQFTIVPGIEGDARLTTLRTVSGDAFFYLNAHGGKGTTKAGVEVFCASSSTPHDAGTDALPEVRRDFDDNLIVYYTGQTGDVPETVATTYAITEAFVKKYMSFSPNAIVFLNVCFSGNSHLEVGKFRNAFHTKNAGVVLGWTKLCNSATAFDSARFFVDRLMAANTFQKENPEQRAFGVNSVLADMARKGKDKDGDSSLLASYKAGVTDVELRATIERLTMDEENDVLVLNGSFGDEQGEVRVNGVAATLVVNWADDELKVRIPATGPGSDGPVVVEVNGKKSKERYLTSWRGILTFKLEPIATGTTLKETADLTYHFRMDIDQVRLRAGDPAKDQLGAVTTHAARDTVLTWSASGNVKDSQGTIHESWSGGGTPPLVYPVITGATNGFNCSMAYQFATKELLLTFTNGGPKTVFRLGIGTSMEGSQSSGFYFKPVSPDWTFPVDDQAATHTVRLWSKINVSFPPPNAFYRKVGTK